jgi:pimeloyl-ACP methyl ester carboxylesterase
LSARQDDWRKAVQQCRASLLTLLDVPDCGHMSPVEWPQIVNEALRAWLAEVVQRSAAPTARVREE